MSKKREKIGESKESLLSKPLNEILAEHPDPVIVKGVLAKHLLDVKKRDVHLERIAGDHNFFACNFIWTYNEAVGQIERFPAWPYIYELVLPKFHAPGNRQWEKCQRMLITISATVYFFWAWLTIRGFSGWMTSRKREKVDDGGGHSTWDSLFGKLRFYYDQLARKNPWVLEHFLGSVPRSDMLFRYMNVANPKLGAAIYGEAPVPTAPTGSGFVKALVDEAAVVPQHHSIHGNLMLSCPNGTHYVSYPNGENNHFGMMHNTPGHFGFEIVEVPHTLRPDFDGAWLEDQRRKLSPDDLGRRVLISFSSSVRGRVWPRFSREQNTVCNLAVDPGTLQLWFDFGFVDATSVGIVQVGKGEFGGVIKSMILVKAWLEVNHSRYVEIAAALKAMLATLGFRGETREIQCYGDPQVKQRAVATGKSLHDLYGEEGFNISGAPAHDTKSTLDEIDQWFAEGRILLDTEAIPIRRAAENWAWPKDRMGNVLPASTQPNHDQFSHAGKAFEYGFASQFMIKSETGKSMFYAAQRTYADVMGRSELF